MPSVGNIQGLPVTGNEAAQLSADAAPGLFGSSASS
jgi:hypothetical protein